jgi:hypothetical protein
VFDPEIEGCVVFIDVTGIQLGDTDNPNQGWDVYRGFNDPQTIEIPSFTVTTVELFYIDETGTEFATTPYQIASTGPDDFAEKLGFAIVGLVGGTWQVTHDGNEPFRIESLTGTNATHRLSYIIITSSLGERGHDIEGHTKYQDPYIDEYLNVIAANRPTGIDIESNTSCVWQETVPLVTASGTGSLTYVLRIFEDFNFGTAEFEPRIHLDVYIKDNRGRTLIRARYEYEEDYFPGEDGYQCDRRYDLTRNPSFDVIGTGPTEAGPGDPQPPLLANLEGSNAYMNRTYLNPVPPSPVDESSSSSSTQALESSSSSSSSSSSIALADNSSSSTQALESSSSSSSSSQSPGPEPPAGTIFSWSAGDISQAYYNAWYNSLPTNPTNGRPECPTSGYNLALPNDHRIGAYIWYEVPTMDANGVLRCTQHANRHNEHNMLGADNPDSNLLDWRYFRPGITYRVRFGITLDPSYPNWVNAGYWTLLWQLHTNQFGSTWSDTQSPPIGLYVDNGEFSLHVRGSTQTIEPPTGYTTKNEYPWAISTGYHDFEIQVKLDYTGADALTRVYMDGGLKHTVTHENTILRSGNTADSRPGGLFMTYGSYGNTVGSDLLFHYLTIEVI